MIRKFMTYGLAAAALVVLTACSSGGPETLNDFPLRFAEAGIPCDQAEPEGSGGLFCRVGTKKLVTSQGEYDFSLSGNTWDIHADLGDSKPGEQSGLCADAAVERYRTSPSSFGAAESYPKYRSAQAVVGDGWWVELYYAEGSTWPDLAEPQAISDALGGGELVTIGDYCGWPTEYPGG